MDGRRECKTNFATLALISLVALVGALFVLPRRLGLPVVIGELLVGLALGLSGFNVLDVNDSSFRLFSDIGFALVMFTAGSHVPLRNPDLRRGLSRGVGRVLLTAGLAMAAGWGIAWIFGSAHGWLYAVLLGSSSAALIMPSLLPGEMNLRPVIEMLPQVALADAACILLLPLVMDPASVVTALVGVGLVIGAAVLLFLLLRWADRNGRWQEIRETSKEHELALELRISLSILFAVAALAISMGVSIMLAGFSLGLAVAAVGEPSRLAKQLFAVTDGFFAPIFFVWLGASINLRDLWHRPQAIALGAALGLGAVAVHAVLWVTKQPLKLAVMTSAQLGVPVAAVTIGQSLGVLAPGENVAILLGALVTVLAHAIASQMSMPAGSRP